MEKIISITELRAAIVILESKQTQEWQILKEQFKTTYTSLKPVNFIKSTINQLETELGSKETLLTAALSIGAGHLSKKMIIGKSNNPFKQCLGNLLQVVVTSFVSKNIDGISSVTKNVIKNIFSRQENKD